MEAKMPEKWDTDLADVCFVSGDYAKAVNGIDARRIVDQRNADVEAAYAAGLEAGYANGFQACLDQARFKVEATTPEPADELRGSREAIEAVQTAINEAWKWEPNLLKALGISEQTRDRIASYRWMDPVTTTPEPAQPAPIVLTPAEQVIWGNVYAAVMSQAYGVEYTWEEIRKDAREEADAAIAALRARSAPAQEAWADNFRITADKKSHPLFMNIYGSEYVRADQAEQFVETERTKITDLERRLGCVAGEFRNATTRIAELETKIAAAQQGAAINRAEGVTSERERCAGIAEKFVGGDLVAKAILNPTK